MKKSVLSLQDGEGGAAICPFNNPWWKDQFDFTLFTGPRISGNELMT